MSSSTRQHTMGEADDNWLRQLVHDFRESEDKPSKAKQASESTSFTDNNPCHVYWQHQFRVSQLGNSVQPGAHLETLNLWVETVNILHELIGDDVSSYVDEWLVLTYYRFFRCYNECHERFTLQGLEGKAHTADRRSAVLEEMKEKMDAEVPKFQQWRAVLMRKEQPPSHQYHKSRFEDATWEGGEDFGGLYNKEPREYTDLMNNEHRLYLSSQGDEPFDVSSLEGNTLITFFTDDLNFWATALLDRLEALAPVSMQTDTVEERAEKETGYLTSW